MLYPCRSKSNDLVADPPRASPSVIAHPPGSQLLLLCPSGGPGNVRGSGGEARDNFVEKAQDAQERVQQVAHEAQSAAQQEAENQGLTQQ